MTTYSVLGNKHAWLFLAAFVAGQAIQLVLQAVTRNLSVYYSSRFCLAAGFIIAVVLFVGMLVDAQTRPGAKPEAKKEAPNEDKAD